ncbi:MAG: MBL fold metallo-hydrolase [Bacteroidia bacterium]|nr:MBL fold metallo-hydrolase [Bacteroidia bacterium]
MIQIQRFIFNPFSENTFIVWDETKEGVIIDPGCHSESERKRMVQFIEKEGINIRYLLNTHGHIDHIAGNSFVKKQWKVPFIAHEKIESEIRQTLVYGIQYGIPITELLLPEICVTQGDSVKFGDTTFSVLYTPGHAVSHISFYDAESRSVFSGDVLFQMGIGRWDFQGGNFDVLMESIINQLLILPEDTTVYCGHGDFTTIGMERRSNPYIKNYLSKI